MVGAKKASNGPARRVVDGWAAVSSLALAKGARIVAGENGGYGVVCWDGSGAVVWQVDLAKVGKQPLYMCTVLVQVVGDDVLALANRGALFVLDLATGKTKKKLDAFEELRGIAMAPNRKTLVCRDGTETDLYEWPSMKRRVHFDEYCNQDCIAISPDGKWLVVAGYEIHVYDLPKRKHVKTWEPAESPWDMCFTASGGHLVTGDAKNMLRLYDAENGFAEVKAFGKNRAPTLTAVAASPDGKWIASANDLGTVLVHDAGTLAVVKELKGHDPTQPDTGARSLPSIAFGDGVLVVGASPKKQPAGLTIHAL